MHDDGKIHGCQLLVNRTGQNFVLENSSGKGDSSKGVRLMEVFDGFGDRGCQPQVESGSDQADGNWLMQILK